VNGESAKITQILGNVCFDLAACDSLIY